MGIRCAVTSLWRHGRAYHRTRRDQARVLECLLAWDQGDASPTRVDELWLLVSSRTDMVEAMGMLLRKGADPNMRHASGGRTALHYAVQMRRDVGASQCDEEGVDVLLGHGARVDVVDNEGETAIDVAKRLGDVRVVARLEGLRGSVQDEV